MKCHVGVDSGSGYIHTITATSANEHDITQTSKDDEIVYVDSGYTGIEKHEEIAKNEHLAKVKFCINRRPSYIKKVSDNSFNWGKYIENRKSSVRCKVEHAFKIIKVDFGFRKTAYKRISKNLSCLFSLCACANLLMCHRAKRQLVF